jgi:hypothetical protein
MAGGATAPSCFAHRLRASAKERGEVLRLKVPSLVVGEDQGVIAGELERHAAARFRCARSTATIGGSMSTTSGLRGRRAEHRPRADAGDPKKPQARP